MAKKIKDNYDNYVKNVTPVTNFQCFLDRRADLSTRAVSSGFLPEHGI